MKRPRKIIWKIYFLIFSTMMAANFLWVIYPEAEPYIFYHILMAWSKYYVIHYSFALLKCTLSLISLIPLFGFSFNRTTRIPTFWQYMLVVRIICDFFGNLYEFMFIKSSYHMVLGYGLTTTGVFLLPLLPSYIAHYLYAFKRESSQ
jgi:hypothetical protein